MGLAMALLVGVGCGMPGKARADGSAEEEGAIRVLVDGETWERERLLQGNVADGSLKVYITWSYWGWNLQLAVLPFGEAHTVEVLLPEGAHNTVEITENAVYMKEADCENQDCVEMGEVTEENLDWRILGGFIVCLPHGITVEVAK